MRTLIFSTKEEASLIWKTLGGKNGSIFQNPRTSVELIEFLDQNEDAVAIVASDSFLEGWCTYHPTNVMFSVNYPTDDAIRTQAKGRVRWQPRVVDRSTLVTAG